MGFSNLCIIEVRDFCCKTLNFIDFSLLQNVSTTSVDFLTALNTFLKFVHENFSAYFSLNLIPKSILIRILFCFLSVCL